MSALSDTSKRALRQQVLELRAKYRAERSSWKIAQNDLERAHESCQQIRDTIQALQIDCGDPTDIDPAYPEDDSHFKPIKGIACE